MNRARGDGATQAASPSAVVAGEKGIAYENFVCFGAAVGCRGFSHGGNRPDCSHRSNGSGRSRGTGRACRAHSQYGSAGAAPGAGPKPGRHESDFGWHQSSAAAVVEPERPARPESKCCSRPQPERSGWFWPECPASAQSERAGCLQSRRPASTRANSAAGPAVHGRPNRGAGQLPCHWRGDAAGVSQSRRVG